MRVLPAAFVLLSNLAVADTKRVDWAAVSLAMEVGDYAAAEAFVRQAPVQEGAALATLGLIHTKRREYPQAEAAFRTAKSDLKLRPIHHRKTDRVEAHLLICFLSLALWRSLEMWMQSKSLGSSARKVVTAFSTIRSMDVTVPVKRAERVLTLRLRTVAKPDADVALLLTHLGLRLPKGSKLVQNVVEKNT
jgi:hypothetical protein